MLPGAGALYIIEHIILSCLGVRRVFLDRETSLFQACRCKALQLAAWLPLASVLWMHGSLAAAAVPAKIDLDSFEALKKSVTLPNAATLAYVSMGDPAGAPVVLIHGYTDSARDWVPLIPYLSTRFHLIVVDLRGHGRSGKPECCYTRWDFAYDVKLLLDALGIVRADIVGHSLGSVIAQTFAETWPQRTRRVVLISSSAGVPDGVPPPKVLTGIAAQIRQLHEPLDADSPFMMQWWASPTPVDEGFARRGRRDSAAIPLRVWRAVLDQTVEPDFTGSELQTTLPRLAAPTLLIWGSEDPLVEEDMRQTLRAALPRAQVKIFPGLGHNPFWEDPAACAQVINAFLTAAPAGALQH
jgi:pimeloyl-ACP methyl ester carboxylesterase